MAKYPEEEADKREEEARETYLKPIVKDPVTDMQKVIKAKVVKKKPDEQG